MGDTDQDPIGSNTTLTASIDLPAFLVPENSFTIGETFSVQQGFITNRSAIFFSDSGNTAFTGMVGVYSFASFPKGRH